MNRYFLSVLVLLAVGFAYGLLRNRARVTKRIPVWVFAILLPGVGIIGLLLASVTGSATLGWMSGISLMVLFPVLMFLGIGLVIGSIFNRSKRAAPVAANPPIGREAPATLPDTRPSTPAMIAGDTIAVSVDRDSVAAGDDTDSHAATADVSVSCNVTELVDAALRACRLASISGGNATWLVDAGGTCIGVIAQQWSRPKFIVAEHTRVTDVFTGKDKAIYFRYWCQADPDAVFEAVRSGQPLPPRY